MRFLIVAERELRAAARRKGTYRARWITAAVFFALLVWLIWAYDGFQNRRAAPDIFEAFARFTFIYCILIGTATTADCLSSERREGTLGLLFLTNLNSAEIVAGKFFSSALAAVYGLVAIFPMLALPMLMGGVTVEDFWKTILALIVTIFFSLASGFVATSVCRKQFTAVAFAMGLAFAYGAGLYLAVSLAGKSAWFFFWRDEIAAFCPLYALNSADGSNVFAKNQFWFSLVAVTGLSLVWLALVAWRLARTWRDQPTSRRLAKHFPTWQRWRQSGGAGRAALRRRLLDINPFFWLGGRNRVSSPIFMCLTTVAIVIVAWVINPLVAATITGQPSHLVVAQLVAWGWTGFAIHALVTYYAAMIASQRLAEDKQTGALELILSTPTTERTIARGLWLAYGRRIFFPVLLATAVHLFFFWQVMTMIVLEPDGDLPDGLTVWQLLRSTLFGELVNGRPLAWMFLYMLRYLLLLLPMLMLVWMALGWVGRWLGLKMKHPGFAPIVAVAMTLVPMVILFSVAIFLFSQFQIYRLPPEFCVPLMMWVSVGIVGSHCLLLSFWAARHLRRDFRTEVMNRFQPPASRFNLRGGLRLSLRVAGNVIAMLLLLALVVALFFGYQNWSSRSAWRAFQNELKQKNESLDVARLLPPPVPDAENFARSPAFRSLMSRTNKATAKLLDNLKQFDVGNTAFANTQATIEWVRQDYLPLDTAAQLFATNSKPPAKKPVTPPVFGQFPANPPAKKIKLGTSTNRLADAAAVLRGLQPHAELLRELAAAARLPRFQVSTNRDASMVLNYGQPEMQTLERTHFLFQLRACALLATNRAPEAGEDFLTSVRLARLAGQTPDPKSIQRSQMLIERSLQPLWEGLAGHQWNESQLAEFQNELARFDLLSDYTNAVRCVVLAQIEIWQTIPPDKTPSRSTSRVGIFGTPPPEEWMARTWVFNNCILLYRAGQNAMEVVDVAGGRIQRGNNWRDLSGLSLDSETQQLLQQNNWWGSNPALVAFAQNAVNQAILACAVERCFLATGKYPETLGALVPSYLDRVPNDLVRGRAMLYQGKVREHYILRSVGPNETDDRKLPVSDDWLWSYPTNAPAMAKHPKAPLNESPPR